MNLYRCISVNARRLSLNLWISTKIILYTLKALFEYFEYFAYTQIMCNSVQFSSEFAFKCKQVKIVIIIIIIKFEDRRANEKIDGHQSTSARA